MKWWLFALSAGLAVAGFGVELSFEGVDRQINE